MLSREDLRSGSIVESAHFTASFAAATLGAAITLEVAEHAPKIAEHPLPFALRIGECAYEL
jgi:hypothetical protein